MPRTRPLGRIIIENIHPQVDGGRFAVKAVCAETLDVRADIFRDGHDLLRASILYRPLPIAETPDLSQAQKARLRRKDWREQSLQEQLNDLWTGQFVVDSVGPWAMTVLAWTDVFGTWRSGLKKKHDAQLDVRLELLEGLNLLQHFARKAKGQERKDLLAFAKNIQSRLDAARDEAVTLALHPRLAQLMSDNDPRDDAEIYPQELPIWVDRPRANFAAWYELFPRSQGRDAQRSASFSQAEGRLEELARQGFDVLYLAPIHPIGKAHRKGANNSEQAQPGDPGSPWAIGSKHGGHRSVHPDLGTLDDFAHFVDVAKAHNLEIALDFAVQCAPDHPWVKAHPTWFRQRPDGSVQYAENPPKKYQDIYPIDFSTEDRDGLYQALLDVLLFWMARGVRIFRVDNPHTKPAGFWEWLIREVHRRDPEVLFLAEAFTRPKRMYRLAKLGFSQSYSYFTWRNSAEELRSYAEELFNSEVADFYRPNFFTNTPDILHEFLQTGGRPGFLIRLYAAATLAPVFGLYSSFELCEARALKPGSEEYLDSEKYQYKVWDWDRPGHIKNEIAQINAIRRAHPALQRARNFHALSAENPALLAFSKADSDAQDRIIVVINVDPHRAQAGQVYVDQHACACAEGQGFVVEDLLTGQVYQWQGGFNYVRLDPSAQQVAHIFQLLSA